MAWYQLYHESKDFTYNRKEVKDHGEGRQLVGTKMTGKRVLVVDDVITAGTAIRESVMILNQAHAVLVGVAVCLDRQEQTSDVNATSAIQVRDSQTDKQTDNYMVVSYIYSNNRMLICIIYICFIYICLYLTLVAS